MLVTEPTFHAPMSSLKDEQAALQPAVESAQKRYDISVICDTSHCPIGPYVSAAAVALAHHESRARRRDARSAKTCCAELTVNSPQKSKAAK